MWNQMSNCPESDEAMLFTLHDGLVVLGYRREGYDEDDNYGYTNEVSWSCCINSEEAIAWMPVPEAYKPC